MDRPFDRARDDLGVAVPAVGMAQQRRDHQRHVHHQAVHVASSVCTAANRARSPPSSAAAGRACHARGAPLASPHGKCRPPRRAPASRSIAGREIQGGPMRANDHRAVVLRRRARLVCGRRRGRRARSRSSIRCPAARRRPAFWRRRRTSSTSTRSTPPAASTARSSSSSRFDNKVNPQESLIQLKKALDEGARYVVQGNGSAVALRDHRRGAEAQRAQSRQGGRCSSTTPRSTRRSPTRSASSGISASTPTPT